MAVCVCGEPNRRKQHTVDWKLKGSWYEITAGPSEINALILLYYDGKWFFVTKIQRDVPSSGCVSYQNGPLIFLFYFIFFLVAK